MSRPSTLPRLIRTFASTSSTPAAAPKASSSGSKPATSAPDSRIELLRTILYPPDSHSPRSAAPTGAYHPQVLERVHHIIQSPEVHETIERAYHHYRRQIKLDRQKALKLKYDAMVEACDELDRLTKGVKEGGEGKWSRDVYLAATEKSNPYKAERVTGRSITPLSRFKEGRLDGLIPREAWVPAESRGKAWNYDWKRPTD